MHAQQPAASSSNDPASLCSSVQRLLAGASYQLQLLEERAAHGAPAASSASASAPTSATASAAAVAARAAAARADDEARATLTRDLNAAFGELSRLDRGLAEGLGGQRSAYFAKKSASLSADALALRSAVERFLRGAFAARRERSQREQLLGGVGQADSVAVDAFLGERRSLASSGSMVDELQQSGEAILGSLRLQRSLLKGVHRKVLDVGSTLGLSSSLMRIIERRTAGDRVLVYGGSVLVALLLVLVLWFTRR